MKSLCKICFPLLFTQIFYSQSNDAIIFTANQEFLSRIYILRMDGTVHSYYQYDFYRFVDLEVVNNELYANDAFESPCSRLPGIVDLSMFQKSITSIQYMLP